MRPRLNIFYWLSFMFPTSLHFLLSNQIQVVAVSETYDLITSLPRLSAITATHRYVNRVKAIIYWNLRMISLFRGQWHGTVPLAGYTHIHSQGLYSPAGSSPAPWNVPSTLLPKGSFHHRSGMVLLRLKILHYIFSWLSKWSSNLPQEALDQVLWCVYSTVSSSLSSSVAWHTDPWCSCLHL